VPSLKTKKDENFVQGIENFIDTMAGKKYTALFISTPVSRQKSDKIKRLGELMYTELSTFSNINLTFGENENVSEADGSSFSFTETLGESVSDATGRTYNYSKTRGYEFFGTHSTTEGDSYSNNHTDSRSTSQAKGKTTSETITKTLGTSASRQFTVQVKTIQELMKKIELQLERIDKGESYGLWESACYFIADEADISLMAANTYRSLLVGEKSNAARSVINYWGEKPSETNDLMAYLRNSIHPVFTKEVKDIASSELFTETFDASDMVNGQELPILMGLPQKSVSGVTSISYASFGRNAQNSDNKNEKDKRKINLGSIYHMGSELSQTRVVLTENEFTKHCFVTGSTGSGKSNTVYRLLEEFINQEGKDEKNGKQYGKIKFLIIEPTKGEYKKAFGNLPGINIFTTNARYYKLLKINPFTFGKDIHVLEHLDRLIEIFSACWPLYAAMPAVLKESFEKAYECVGWDLQNSEYIGEGKTKYPNFKTVLDILPEVIESSQFSAENKGNYTGALVTRVKSLTLGIMGTIFTEEEIQKSDEVLFDQNTIVDISRVGSSETKSLIMGILILKLNEYRMSEDKGTDLPLRHITVLEEAHNILKRTSTDQNQEGANLAGKSVEMISNSIAEMRTYGEGFIIVDQSPAMVAQSAITNTNTKIIMRLADYGDCEVVGRSVSLDDEQIKEISRLNQGVAVVHQSSWTEAVLAKIDFAKKTEEEYKQKEKVKPNDFKSLKKMRGELLLEIFKQRKENSINRGKLYVIIESPNDIQISIKNIYKRYIENIEMSCKDEDKFAEMMVNIMDCKGMIGACVRKFQPLDGGQLVRDTHYSDAEKMLYKLEYSLKLYIDINDKNIIRKLCTYIVYSIFYPEKEAQRWNSNSFVASWAALKLVLNKECEELNINIKI